MYSLFIHSQNKRYPKPDSGNISFEERLNTDVQTQQITPVPTSHNFILGKGEKKTDFKD
jgi:hypothetical protein